MTIETFKKKMKTCAYPLGLNEKCLVFPLQLHAQLTIYKSRYFGESWPNFISTSPEKYWPLISPNSRMSDNFEIGKNLTLAQK